MFTYILYKLILYTYCKHTYIHIVYIHTYIHTYFLSLTNLNLCNTGVWYDGATSRDLVSPERRRNPDAEAAIGSGDLRYPYSPEQSPTRRPVDREDHLGSGE